jgi:hypothetical protein
LSFARKLKAAGVPAEQAEAQAEIMAEAFLYNVDSLVTRDYLGSRLGELEAHMDVKFANLRILYWMIAGTWATVAIPLIRDFLN